MLLHVSVEHLLLFLSAILLDAHYLLFSKKCGSVPRVEFDFQPQTIKPEHKYFIFHISIFDKIIITDNYAMLFIQSILSRFLFYF